MEKVIEIKNGIIRQQNTTILSDLEFSVGPQDFVYLIGRTGSGKSTLLKAIYGELPLSEGTGTVAATPWCRLQEHFCADALPEVTRTW
jgi:cell division transport system ATP-binding protein